MAFETGDVPKLKSAAEAAALIQCGWMVLCGGFGSSGAPHTMIEALSRRPDLRDLAIVSNNLGEPGIGLGKLLVQGQVRTAIGSYFTANPDVAQAYAAGTLEVRLLPQGTMSEALRAGGAGIPAFYTPTAAGTKLAEGKETREFDGKLYVLERALHAEVAMIRAARADTLGNLVYRTSGRNFNPMMATAADLVIAEVEEIVPVGALPPESVVTPHLFVDVLVLADQTGGINATR
jgi:3-oxoacid CoA-transferase A subunit